MIIRTERGWAAHSQVSDRCRFHRFFREKPGLSGRGGIAAHPQGCGFFAMDFHRLTKFTENTIICK